MPLACQTGIVKLGNKILPDGSRIRVSAVLFVVARRRVDGIFADIPRLDNEATAKMTVLRWILEASDRTY